MGLFKSAIKFVAREAAAQVASQIGEHVGDAIGTLIGRRIDPNHRKEPEAAKPENAEEKVDGGKLVWQERCWACCQENCGNSRCYCDCHRCSRCGAVGDHYCSGSYEGKDLVVATLSVKCKIHPRYQGVGKPRLPCEACWRIYIKEHP